MSRSGKKPRRGVTSLDRQADGSFLLSGPYAFPGETEPSFIHLKSTGGVPVIGSVPLATAIVGRPFNYRVVASGEPASYSASGLPGGFSIDPQSGVVSGEATGANVGVHSIVLTAANAESLSTKYVLTLTVPPLPQLLAAASRKTHGSANTDFDIDLPLTGALGIECRVDNTSGSLFLVLTFNNDVSGGTASVTAGGATLAAQFSPDGRHAFVSLDNVANAQVVRVQLGNVKDRYLQLMPNTEISLGVLRGDVNGDGTVNVSDALVTRGRSGSGLDPLTFRADVNRDGSINSGDSIAVEASPAPD